MDMGYVVEEGHRMAGCDDELEVGRSSHKLDQQRQEFLYSTSM